MIINCFPGEVGSSFLSVPWWSKSSEDEEIKIICNVNPNQGSSCKYPAGCLLQMFCQNKANAFLKLFLLFLLFLGNHEFSCRSFRLSKLATSVLYCKGLHSKLSVTQKKKKFQLSISFKVNLRSSVRPESQSKY